MKEGVDTHAKRVEKQNRPTSKTKMAAITKTDGQEVLTSRYSQAPSVPVEGEPMSDDIEEMDFIEVEFFLHEEP